MGKKSVKENKNAYQNSREEAGFTRQQASELMEFISADNYYCSNKCPIGKEYVPQVEFKDLTQITLEVLSTLNSLGKEKDRFIEIAADSRTTKEEIPDFLNIKRELEQISLTADSLRLWIDHSIAKGEMDPLE